MLSPFKPEELAIIGRVVDQTALAAEVVISEGVPRAQARFNRKDLSVNTNEEVRV